MASKMVARVADRNFGRECFCFGSEAARGLVKSGVDGGD